MITETKAKGIFEGTEELRMTAGKPHKMLKQLSGKPAKLKKV